MEEKREKNAVSTRPKNKRDTAAYRNMVYEYIQQHPEGISTYVASVDLHIQPKTVLRYLRILKSEGVEMPPIVSKGIYALVDLPRLHENGIDIKVLRPEVLKKL